MSLDEPRTKRAKRGDGAEVEMITVKRVNKLFIPLLPLPDSASFPLTPPPSPPQNCMFCSLKEALSVDWSKKPAKYFRRTPSTYFTIQSEHMVSLCVVELPPSLRL